METHSSIRAEQPRPSEEHLKHFYLTCFSAAKCQDVTPLSHQPERWDNLLQPLLSWERAAELHRCLMSAQLPPAAIPMGKWPLAGTGGTSCNGIKAWELFIVVPTQPLGLG